MLVTPRLAALVGGVGGTLALQIGGRRVPVRVAAVVDHFPGTTGEAVIGDITSLATAVNTQVPGAGETNEVWLDAPTDGVDAAMAALAQPPFRGLESVSREGMLDEARDDPLGHGTLLALDSAAIVALLLAALGLALTVLSDLRDDRGDLYDLESQGAEPRLLRRIVRVRALVVGIAGVLAGAAGRGLARAPRHARRLRDRARNDLGPADADIVRPRRRRHRRSCLSARRGGARRARDPAGFP